MVAVEELKRKERWFRALIEHSTDAIILLARDGAIIYANPSTEHISGYPAEEFVGKNIYNFVHSADWEHVAWNELLDRADDFISFESRVRHKNGLLRWIEGTITNLLSNPKVRALMVSCSDITERKLREKQLQQSEEHYRAVVEQAFDGIFLTDAGDDGYIVEVNEAFCCLAGYSREELLTRKIADLAREEDRKALAIGRDALLAGETLHSQWLMKRKDGSLIRTEFIAKQLSNGYLQGTVRDVSERVRAEKERARLLASEQQARAEAEELVRQLKLEQGALRKAEQEAEQHASHLAAVFDAMTDGVVVCATDGKILQANAAFHRILGIDEEERTAITIVEKRDERLVPHDLEGNPLPKDQWPSVRILRGECLSDTNTVDLLCYTPEGQPIFVNTNGAPIYDDAEKIVGAVIVIRDVTERRQLEQRLQYSERKYRALVDSNIVGVQVGDSDGRIYEVNDYVAEMFGYNKEELLSGKVPWYQFIPPGLSKEDDHITQTLGSTGVVHILEKEYVRKDGSRVPTLVAGAMLDRDHNRGVMMFLDISDRKEAERRKQEFLGMVSHELRTPLTGIVGFLELAQLYLQELPRDYSSEVKSTLDRLEGALKRTNQQANIETRLVETLLDVSRMEMHHFDLVLKECNLVNIVREVIACQRQIVLDHTIEPHLPELEEVPALVDEERIEQVILNYLTNAIKYSPDGTPITIGLTLDDTTVQVFVRDQGPGLTPDQQQRVWERFYQVAPTTGHGDEGSLGLGLYIAQIIVQQHGGQVGVESEPGRGSTFWFTLPLATVPRPSQIALPG